jgi:hypothetical protein
VWEVLEVLPVHPVSLGNKDDLENGDHQVPEVTVVYQDYEETTVKTEKKDQLAYPDLQDFLEVLESKDNLVDPDVLERKVNEDLPDQEGELAVLDSLENQDLMASQDQ